MGVLRATQQYIEVLVSNVPQVYEVAAISALSLASEAGCNIRSVVADSTLGLVDVAGRNNLPNLSADSVLSLVADAGRNNLPNLSAESVLDLAVVAQNSIHPVSAESVLALVGVAGRNNLPSATAESTLALSDAASASRISPAMAANVLSDLNGAATVSVVRSLSAQSTIALVQTEHTVRPWYKAAQNAIALVQVEQTARPWYLSAETPLQTYTEQYDPETDTFYPVYEGLQDSASVGREVTEAIRQVIPLFQSATVVRVKATAINVSAGSVLELLGEVRPNQTGDAGNWLLVSQTAAADRCKLVTSELALTDEAAVWVSILRGAASALALSQAATYSIVSGGVLQQYTPFVGEGASGSPPPPSTVIEPPDYVGLPFKLFYPAEGGITDYVTLRAPNLGNKDRLSFNRILRETRGGTLIVFADPIWPKIQTLVLTFSGLRSVQAQQLLAFLETHLGEEIGLLDWEGRAWKGIVTAPHEPVVQDGKDSFSASLEFEGELVPA